MFEDERQSLTPLLRAQVDKKDANLFDEKSKCLWQNARHRCETEATSDNKQRKCTDATLQLRLT